MRPVEIKRDVYWVGALDWNIRDFHGYSTPKGTTYNAYLVIDEKIALFDTVKKPFKNDLIENISKIIDPGLIDYIVVNHVEMDHSGSMPDIVELVGPEKVVCSPMGKKALIDHYGRQDWPYHVVETGQTLKLGKKTVSFLETRMLHWPDNMMSYIPEDKLLLTSDGFGQHWATSQRFDDEVDAGELYNHAAKYYANILLLFSPLRRKSDSQGCRIGVRHRYDSSRSRPYLAKGPRRDNPGLSEMEQAGKPSKSACHLRYHVAGDREDGLCSRRWAQR